MQNVRRIARLCVLEKFCSLSGHYWLFDGGSDIRPSLTPAFELNLLPRSLNAFFLQFIKLWMNSTVLILYTFISSVAGNKFYLVVTFALDLQLLWTLTTRAPDICDNYAYQHVNRVLVLFFYFFICELLVRSRPLSHATLANEAFYELGDEILCTNDDWHLTTGHGRRKVLSRAGTRVDLTQIFLGGG